MSAETPRASPRNADGGSTGIIRSPPLNATTVSLVPGLSPMRCRSASGMTTWNLGDTVTQLVDVVISMVRYV